ncbi:MAG: cyclic nucleotide-binding domain-containing protein [Elusimicrobiales bacterium]|jgi:CRP-like cAMP-binding protein|nr:cyclic nucleotide-binding domain-containing protein [Elusimicrobiales bacterium]
MSGAGDLRSVPIFRNFSDEMLAQFSEAFKQSFYKKDEVIFRERSEGDTLFIIVSGSVAIEKKLDDEGKAFKTLAILSAGEFFGEMAVLEGQTRFAQARAESDSVLYEVRRAEFFSFIRTHPGNGISIFTEIMKSVLRRLQHTSSELTMLFDMSKLVLREYRSPKEFLAEVLDEVYTHFEGSWNISVFAYNQFNEEFDEAGTRSTFEESPEKAAAPPPAESGWTAPNAYVVVFRGRKGPLGYMRFARSADFTDTEKNALSTIFGTLSSIISSAVENIEHQAEAALMRKLKEQKNTI